METSLLTIPTPSHRIDATVEVPGSKSITNRALLVAALADGESTISHALFSEDTRWFSACLHRLGITVTGDPARATFRVSGRGGAIPLDRANLFVGNAGTAARFVTAMTSLGDGEYRLDGVPRMRERPMSELLKILETMGAEITFEGRPGSMPFVLRAHGFRGGQIRMQAGETSQQLSALLMVAPYARQDTTISVAGTLVSRPYVDITRRVMADFGVETRQVDDSTFAIKAGRRYRPRDYAVEPDASSASYFFAAAAVTGGRVRVNGLSRHSCQGDLRFVEVLEVMGCTVRQTDAYTEVIGPERLRGVDVDMNGISDTVQTLAAIAPFASSPVTIRNVEHIRGKETDRLSAVAAELSRLGIRVDESPDGLRIHPGDLTPGPVNTYDDHRMAMAFAVPGLRVPGITILDPGCTAKTFPDFFDRLLHLAEGR